LSRRWTGATGPLAGALVAGAALEAGGNAASITGLVATNTTGRDGNFWKSAK